MPFNFKTCLMFVFLLPFAFSSVFGQGVLVNEGSVAVQLPRVIIFPPRRPHPPLPPMPRPEPVESSYAIKSLEVNTNITGQIADVSVSQTFVNTGKTQMEVSFVFPLPYDGAINSMTLLVNGKEFNAKLLDAKAARKTYEDIVRRNQDPALLEWIGNGMFKTSVFPIPAGESRVVNLKYTQLLKVDGGLTDFLFTMSTAKYTSKPIEKLEINLNVETSDEIKNIYSPTHEIKIKRPTSNKAVVIYDAKEIIPSSDFRLFYDSGKNEVSTKLLSFRPDPKEDGYFMLLASPKFAVTDQKQVAKNILFVLDNSGSMSGKKIVQARDALKFILNNLREEDTFNIIQYSNNATKFKEEIQPATKEFIAEATSYAESIRAAGGTNISDALNVSLAMIQDNKVPNYVLFLTDGCPTVGEANEFKLNEISINANKNNARIFAFGVGYDVNGRLLDRIARSNRGQTEYVKPDENIEDRVSRMYNRISSPILTDVTFNVVNKNDEKQKYTTNRIYPNGNFDLFSGEQLVIVGRYSKAGKVAINVEGKVGADTKTFTFDGELVEESKDQTSSFISRLWAIRRIGEILDQIDLKGQNKELVDELVALSTTYGILTPYTSFLADDTVALTDRNSNAATALSKTSALKTVTGGYGIEQRSSKLNFQNAQSLDSFYAQNALSNSNVEREGKLLARGSAGRAYGGGGVARLGMPSGAPRSSLPTASAPVMSGSVKVDAAGESSEVSAPELSVQSVNNRSFFNKAGIWVDSTLSETQMKPENMITVKQFSEEYFNLIAKHKEELTPYLTIGGSQIVNVKGQAYNFVP
ncbi:MAG: VWA domain-containing protein [Planctomycetaceae bacterium]|jgi:Ca-activated chloride channel family protein|nr:VWA domain-containing protein [Planctomycetaceae bacterium]